MNGNRRQVNFEIIAEVTPLLNRDKLVRKLEQVSQYVHFIDIPESPGGRPTAHSIAVGVLAKRIGLEPIVHFRLLDLNMTAFKSLLGAARLLDIGHVVMLQGDPPLEGAAVRDVATEAAVDLAKKMGLKAGALLSLRRDYRKRLEIGADFYLALHFREPAQLEDLPPVVYPYVIIGTDKNVELLGKLGQPYFTPQEAVEVIERMRGLVPGAVISAPGDFGALLQVLSRIRHI